MFVSNIGSEHFIGLAGSAAARGIGIAAWEFNVGGFGGFGRFLGGFSGIFKDFWGGFGGFLEIFGEFLGEFWGVLRGFLGEEGRVCCLWKGLLGVFGRV